MIVALGAAVVGVLSALFPAQRAARSVVDRQSPSDGATTLKLEGIHKSYGSDTAHETEALHGIDLSLARGEFAALIGPSGSGKSTLLNIIGLLDKPSTGKIFLTGQEANKLADKALTELRARAIGFVSQFHNLLPAFTAVENVMLPLLAALGKPGAAMRTRALELIDQAGLKPWGHHPVQCAALFCTYPAAAASLQWRPRSRAVALGA